jgi:hypothetical protein
VFPVRYEYSMACYKLKTGRWIMSSIVPVIFIYHPHRPINRTNLLGS